MTAPVLFGAFHVPVAVYLTKTALLTTWSCGQQVRGEGGVTDMTNYAPIYIFNI